jgi:hypothetical protein
MRPMRQLFALVFWTLSCFGQLRLCTSRIMWRQLSLTPRLTSLHNNTTTSRYNNTTTLLEISQRGFPIDNDAQSTFAPQDGVQR